MKWWFLKSPDFIIFIDSFQRMFLNDSVLKQTLQFSLGYWYSCMKNITKYYKSYNDIYECSLSARFVLSISRGCLQLDGKALTQEQNGMLFLWFGHFWNIFLMVWERCSGSPPSFPSFLSSSAGPSQRVTTVYQICDLCSIFIAKVFKISMKIWRFFTKICSHLLD